MSKIVAKLELRRACLCFGLCVVATMMTCTGAHATENGACVYPVGVETVMPGMIPPPHGTVLYEFSAFYAANEMDNSLGKSADPGFKVRVMANAFKIVHNWDIPVFGGKLNSNVAVPTIYQQLHIAPGLFTKAGVSNIVIGVFQVGYEKGALHWYYEGDAGLPGQMYSKTDILNIGQNNYAATPVGGFTYLPRRGEWELSSKVQYIVNFHDVATHYTSGNELTWEYDAMKEVSHQAALGLNGYLYKQTTDDVQNGLRVGDGNRGRDLAVGPEVRMHLGAHGAFALKYFRDTLVENKPRGNYFWFELGVPLSIGRGGARK